MINGISCRVIGPFRRGLWLPAAMPVVAFFAYHAYYLAFVKLDYGYNMRVNITVGEGDIIFVIVT